jgi:single-strand DNA-binding protein
VHTATLGRRSAYALPGHPTRPLPRRRCRICGAYLAKGRQVAVDGRLRYSSWQTDDGSKRSKVEVIASSVQFLGSREGAGQEAPSERPAPAASDFGDDIPF